MQQIINNGDSGLTVLTALNDMFSELYSAIVIPIKIKGIAANTQYTIPGNSFIHDIFISTVAGAPDVRIGTTPNGIDIVPDTAIGGTPLQTSVEQYVSGDTLLYITITGGTVNIRINIEADFY